MHTLNNPDLVDLEGDGDPPHENDSPAVDTDSANTDSADTLHDRLLRLEDHVRLLVSNQAPDPNCALCCRSHPQDASSPSSLLTQLAEAKVVECEVLRSALAAQAAQVGTLQEEVAEREERILKEKKEVAELREKNEALTEMLANRDVGLKSTTANIIDGVRQLKLQPDQPKFREAVAEHVDSGELEELEEFEMFEKLDKIAKEREGEFRRAVYLEPVAADRAEGFATLEAIIKEHEYEIQRLQRLLEEQKTETMDAQRERNEIKNALKDRDEQLAELGANVEHFKAKAEENDELILDISATAEVYKSKVEAFERENEAREREFRELEELLELQETQNKTMLANVVATKDGMIRELEGEVIDKGERIGELEDNIEDLENFVGALEDEIKQLQEQIAQRNADPISEHKKAAAAAKDEMITELLEQVTVKNEKIADLEESVAAKDERGSRLGAIVEGLESEIRWLQDALRERVAETEQAREAQPRTSRLEQQAEDLRTQLDALRLSDFNHARDIERLQREVAEKDAQIIRMSGLIIKYQEEAAKFRAAGGIPGQSQWVGYC